MFSNLVTASKRQKLESLNEFHEGEFTHRKAIGRGAFGNVFRVEIDGKTFAVKEFDFQEWMSEGKKILKEALIHAKLQHDNVVQLLGLCHSPFSLLMEYCAFDFNALIEDSNLLPVVHSLKEYLEYTDLLHCEGFESYAIKCMDDILKGMTYLHSQKIVHRDLKPCNILPSNKHYVKISDYEDRVVAMKDNPIILKIGDYGEARSEIIQTKTAMQTKKNDTGRGTTFFMAPEVLPGSSMVSFSKEDLQRADLWSVGMTLFTVCSPDLEHPFVLEMKSEGFIDIDKLFDAKLRQQQILPQMSEKYAQKMWKSWSSILMKYYQLCRFNPIERIQLSEINRNHLSIKHLSCSQETRSIQRSERLIRGNPADENEEKKDGLSACTFLCLKFGQRMESGDISHDATSCAEDVILNYPALINQHRDAGRFYDPEEAKRIMENYDKDYLYHSIEQLCSLPNLKASPVFTSRAFEDLCIGLETQCSKKLPNASVYTAGGYTFCLSATAEALFLLDTHPVPHSSGGDLNGCLLVSEGNSKDSILEIATWIYRRLANALSETRTYHQSLSLMIPEVEKEKSLNHNLTQASIPTQQSTEEVPILITEEIGITPQPDQAEGVGSKNIAIVTIEDEETEETDIITSQANTIHQTEGIASKNVGVVTIDDEEGSTDVGGFRGADQSTSVDFIACNNSNDVGEGLGLAGGQSASMDSDELSKMEHDSQELDYSLYLHDTHAPVYSAKKLQFKKKVEICVGGLVGDEKLLSTRVPQNVEQDSTYVVDLRKVEVENLSVDGFVYATHTSPSIPIDVTLEFGSVVCCKQLQKGTQSNHTMKVQRSTAVYEQEPAYTMRRVITKFLTNDVYNDFAVIEYTFLYDKKAAPVAQPHLFRRFHKNSRNKQDVHCRTFPTVLKEIKENAYKTPKQIVDLVRRQHGDSLSLTSPSDTVRNRTQVYNALRKVPREKSGSTGVVKTCDYQKLQVMLLQGDVVKKLVFATGKDKGTILPRVYCGTDLTHSWAGEYTNVKSAKSVLGLDMTFKCGPFYVTPVTMKHPLLVWREKAREHTNVGIAISLAITPTKDTEDYLFLSRSLSSFIEKRIIFGSDGETALLKGMEDTFPIENVPAEASSIGLRCFTHVQGNIEKHLDYVSPKEKMKIERQVLGAEYDGKRLEGLVDSKDVETFDVNYQRLKLSWPDKFVKFLEDTKGKHRSLVEALKVNMLKPVRIAAGLGCPPNKFTNNLNESVNKVIKEANSNARVDMVTFIENVKTRVFEHQRKNCEEALYGMGDYKLTELGIKRLGNIGRITPQMWSYGMNLAQQRAVFNNVYGRGSDEVLQPTIMQTTNVRLSVPLERCSLSSRFSISTIKELWANAEFILSNGAVSKLLSGSWCVQDFDTANVVSKEESTVGVLFRCNCSSFMKMDGICKHTVSVAETENLLSELISRYNSYAGNLNKMMQSGMPKKAGDKSHQKKPRKGKNNVQMKPILSVVDDEDPELDVAKPQTITEYWQNNEKFYVQLVNEPDSDNAKNCIDCGREFPKLNPAVGDDLVIMHKERYKYPVKEHGVFQRYDITTNKIGRKYYCVDKHCLLNRHPFFWKGLLFIKRVNYDKLIEGHWQKLYQRLHFDPRNVEE